MEVIPEAAVTAAWIEADLPDDVTKDVARRILEAAAPHMEEAAYSSGFDDGHLAGQESMDAE